MKISMFNPVPCTSLLLARRFPAAARGPKRPCAPALCSNQRVPRSGSAALCSRCRFPATESTRGSCLPRGVRRPRTGALELTHRPRSGRLVVPGSVSATPAVPISARRVQMGCDPAGAQRPPPVVRRTRSGRSQARFFSSVWVGGAGSPVVTGTFG
ncbi:hypothetical protein NDU88_001572 [Pleurodeles waltl]|uniref:Uncharacterized protein n=1 Tax=Pleurodeles waltl TaxID=8319 RepID=A0AAV7Q6I2_PLEWA|nr:hypothetical protein NDU88_001572 [Pleurodeles waltl]